MNFAGLVVVVILYMDTASTGDVYLSVLLERVKVDTLYQVYIAGILSASASKSIIHIAKCCIYVYCTDGF